MLAAAALEIITFIVVVIVIPAGCVGLWMIATRPWGKR